MIPLIIGAVVVTFVAHSLGVPAPFSWLIGAFVATILGGMFSASTSQS